MQSSGEITKKINPYNITKQIQCTYRTTFKTIRATEIGRSARIKCLEVLSQIPTWISFIVINMLASFGGSLMTLNTFICTKSVNWGAKCWKISRGVSLGLHFATTFEVYSDCTINIYMYICYLLSFCMFYFWSTETWLEKRNNDINDPSSLNPGGICDSGLSLNRYRQAHPGDTGKCPSKLTAYISIVPT